MVVGSSRSAPSSPSWAPSRQSHLQALLHEVHVQAQARREAGRIVQPRRTHLVILIAVELRQPLLACGERQGGGSSRYPPAIFQNSATTSDRVPIPLVGMIGTVSSTVHAPNWIAIHSRGLESVAPRL